MFTHTYRPMFSPLNQGYPEPEYLWLKDGLPIGGGGFSPQHFHKIPATRREDAGIYQCVARNIAGAIFGEKIRVSVAYTTI
ncbi:hypothetical protein J437_LFUL007941 [Ladona fulva]|uniref:Ig-like domain-containing protein n=1 Tax=Ladona fulva TaxID=123851 RepID=A0A8K0KA21_LADFU|nr:hypothetical protein J437_LFUL007941 [Ladona fulva]